jgi:hypothetical protein
MRHQDDSRTGRSLGVKDSSREQSLNFDIVETSRMVVIRETHGAMRMMYL